MSAKRKLPPNVTRTQQLAADIERWSKMMVVCVNAPDPERAARVMQIVVECNLRRLDGEELASELTTANESAQS